MKKKHEYGQSWSIAAALLDGPKNFDQLTEYFRVMARRFGVFVDLLDRGQSGRSREMEAELSRSLESLLKNGWVTRQGELYTLTEFGREEAHVMLRDLERGGRFIETATRPESVSKVTLIVHFVLAAIKLPAALLSGSVGLLNDALDTLMDGISSLFVFLGVRSGREREVSWLLLVFMGATGLYSLYEALSRFFGPVSLSADPAAFAAVAVSGMLCVLLWAYQKFSGLKHSCVPLIAQSVDSRNHVIVAGGVAAGLLAAVLDFPLLDRIVGIAVSVLILKGAAELLIDLLRSSGEEEIDMSRYGFTRLERHRTRQMVRWFLLEMDKGRITTREELIEEAKAATDFGKIASLRALGLAEPQGQEKKIDEAVNALFTGKLVEEGSRLFLTPAGEAELRSALADGWSLPGMPRGVIALALLLSTSAALYAGIFFLFRFLIGFLPPFDVWIDMEPFQIACMSAGFVLYHFGRRLAHKARHRLHHVRTREGGREEKPLFLVTDAPFDRRRHPMYAGFILINLGIGIGLYSGYALIWAAVAVTILLFSIPAEERSLAGWFTEEYADYRAGVPIKIFFRWEWAVLFLLYAAAWAGV